SLQRLLVLDYALALVGVPRRIAVHVFCQHRPSSLLELEKDHVLGATPLQQRHIRPQAHTADANDFVRDVDERVATESAPPMRRQRVKVLIQSLGDRLVLLSAEPSDQRRVFDDVPFAVALHGKPRKRTVTGARAGTLSGAVDFLTKRLL